MVIAALKPHRPHRGQQIARALFAIPRLLSATAGYLSRNRSGLLQQVAERRRSGPVHGGSRCRFDSLQVESTSPVQPREEDAEKLVYFPCDFLVDRFGRFFSCSDRSGSSMGRSLQIFSFTSSRS